MGNVIANLIVDEALNDVLLMRANDDAAHVGVIGFGKEIPWVRGIAAVFKRYEVVFLITGHVVGVRHAIGRIDLSRVGIDKFRPGLCASSVPLRVIRGA